MTESVNNDVLRWGRDVLSIEAEGILTVRNKLDDNFVKAVDIIFACKGRVITSGIGKSGIIARKIAATLSSTGTPAFFLHPVEALHGDLGMVRSEDVLLTISNSGETVELVEMIKVVKPLGIKIITLTGNPVSSIARISNVVINVGVPREACAFGLAPTTSTTAALATGDAIAVALTRKKDFNEEDFHNYHPGGHLGQRLKVPVVQLMRKGADIPAVVEGAGMENVVGEMNLKGMGATLVVGQDGKLKGIFTDGDLRRAITKWGKDLYSKKIDDVMTSNPKTILVDASVADALQVMERFLITVLPVVDKHGDVVGILHLHDLLGKGQIQFRLSSHTEE